MKRAKLEYLSYTELKDIASEMEIPVRRSKDDLIDDILAEFREYEKYKKEKIEKYTRHEQLGKPGKEGITYRVTTKNNNEYAMKTFKKNKSSDRLLKEAELQKMAADMDVAPEVVDIDTVSKYIVMEKLDTHLVDIMKKQGGLTLSQQKQIIQVYKKLDKAGVFHGDINLANFMIKGKKLYIIDYGKARHITSGLVKKLGTDTPNQTLMTLGLVLKLKEIGFDSDSYEYLEKFLENERKFG
jgi:predicted Ser/Thr protein kinase